LTSISPRFQRKLKFEKIIMGKIKKMKELEREVIWEKGGRGWILLLFILPPNLDMSTSE
jgi:hypothetical protein